MGTDIHLEVEALGPDGVWHWVEHPDRPCDDELCTDGRYNERTPNKDLVGKDHYQCGGTGHYVDQFWSDRNYDVFAILADVRNGMGFAGIDTGDGFVPIVAPRGLPRDLSPEIRAELDKLESSDDYWETASSDWKTRPDVGEHSQSWLTVAEILNYDWERTTKKRGWVDPWNFELWRREGKPSSWSGGVSGAMIEHVSNLHMARMIDTGEIQWTGPEPADDDFAFYERGYTTPLQRTVQEMGDFPEGSHGAQIADQGSRYYTNVEWEIPYLDSARGFLKVLHRDIEPLGEPNRVRLVFGFDS